MLLLTARLWITLTSSVIMIIMVKNRVTLTRTQLTFACSKSTIETLEKDVKYVQSLQ